MVRFAKWGEMENFVYVSVRRKGGLVFFPPSGCTCDMLVKIKSNRFEFPCY